MISIYKSVAAAYVFHDTLTYGIKGILEDQQA